MNTLANPIQQIHTQIQKKELKHDTKVSHQITREEGKRGKEVTEILGEGRIEESMHLKTQVI